MRNKIMFAGLLISTTVFGQKKYDAVYRTMSSEICNCAIKKDLSKAADRKDGEMMLGFCMLESYNKHKEELPSNEQFDFVKDPKKLEKFGSKIGVFMAGDCPNIFTDLSKSSTVSSPVAEGNTPGFFESFQGTFSGLTNDCYPTLVLKDLDNKKYDFLWLTYFPGADEMIENAASFQGKKMTILFQEEEVYLPALKKHIKQKVIKSIEKE